MTSGSGLDLVSNQVARLERVRHRIGAIANSVADTDGTELVTNEVSILERGFDLLAKAQQVLVASDAPNIRRIYSLSETETYGFPSYLIGNLFVYLFIERRA